MLKTIPVLVLKCAPITVSDKIKPEFVLKLAPAALCLTLKIIFACLNAQLGSTHIYRLNFAFNAARNLIMETHQRDLAFKAVPLINCFIQITQPELALKSAPQVATPTNGQHLAYLVVHK